MSADSIQQTFVVYSTNSSISSSSSTLTNGIQIGRNFIRNQSIEEHYTLHYFNFTTITLLQQSLLKSRKWWASNVDGVTKRSMPATSYLDQMTSPCHLT